MTRTPCDKYNLMLSSYVATDIFGDLRVCHLNLCCDFQQTGNLEFISRPGKDKQVTSRSSSDFSPEDASIGHDARSLSG